MSGQQFIVLHHARPCGLVTALRDFRRQQCIRRRPGAERLDGRQASIFAGFRTTAVSGRTHQTGRYGVSGRGPCVLDLAGLARCRRAGFSPESGRGLGHAFHATGDHGSQSSGRAAPLFIPSRQLVDGGAAAAEAKAAACWRALSKLVVQPMITSHVRRRWRTASITHCTPGSRPGRRPEAGSTGAGD